MEHALRLARVRGDLEVLTRSADKSSQFCNVFCHRLRSVTLSLTYASFWNSLSYGTASLPIRRQDIQSLPYCNIFWRNSSSALLFATLFVFLSLSSTFNSIVKPASSHQMAFRASFLPTSSPILRESRCRKRVADKLANGEVHCMNFASC